MIRCCMPLGVAGESVYASPGGASTHRPSPLAPNPRVPDWGARVAALQEEMQAQRECGQAEEAKLLDKLQARLRGIVLVWGGEVTKGGRWNRTLQ